jgi:hypothetical protein
VVVVVAGTLQREVAVAVIKLTQGLLLLLERLTPLPLVVVGLAQLLMPVDRLEIILCLDQLLLLVEEVAQLLVAMSQE